LVINWAWLWSQNFWNHRNRWRSVWKPCVIRL
jgi:hypothetical protein